VRLHHLRNATFVLEAAGERVLVDPMLGRKGQAPPLAVLRSRPRLNPTVDLPQSAAATLEHVTAAVITHYRRGHVDHLDRSGRRYLEDRAIPVFCRAGDEGPLRRRGIDARPVAPSTSVAFVAGGTITAFAAVHGYGLIATMMGPGAGYLIELPNEPSVYVSGDTVLTPTAKQVLRERKPEVAIMAAGTAKLDIGRPILMPLEEQVEFVRLAPGIVIANHLEAVNHCHTDRAALAARMAAEGLSGRVRIPADGETVEVLDTAGSSSGCNYN
jgi:L-ascorbate metabolism protein UlaG (beta-lactamase superfamily)